jgi:cell wall-associated NlpC family hydrolase
MMALADRIVAEARTWIGTRFAHQGRLKNVGVDCAGLIVCVCANVGITINDKIGYSMKPDGVSLKAQCDEQLTRIDSADIVPGDVLLFRFENDPQHLAFVGGYPTGGLSIIHAYSLARRNKLLGWVVESRLDDVWRKRMVSAYRITGDDA